jgi:hypothetical protein
MVVAWEERAGRSILRNSGVGSRNRGEVATLHGWNEGNRGKDQERVSGCNCSC